MKSNKGLLILAAFFVVLIGGAYVLYSNLSAGHQENLVVQESQDTGDSAAGTEQEESEAEERMMAPIFQVTDGGGNPVVLSDFYGKPIVVNFWASWCGPCKSEMPDFQTAYETYGEDVNFLMVNMTDGTRETEEKAKAYVAEQGYTFPVYFDTESNAAITYGVMSIPSTFFIDAEGYAVAYAQGAIDGEMLQTGLDMILTVQDE